MAFRIISIFRPKLKQFKVQVYNKDMIAKTDIWEIKIYAYKPICYGKYKDFKWFDILEN